MTVKLIRMWSGEDVIADITKEDTDSITFTDPIVAVPSQQQGQIAFAPWSPLLQKDKLEVTKKYIVYIGDPQGEIIEQYNTMFGKISKPTKNNFVMETHRKTLPSSEERAYKENFTLSSGKSEHYINCKPVTLSCEGNALCSHLMIEHIEDDSVAVGGLTLGADPLVCGIAQKAYYSGKHIDALIVERIQRYGKKLSKVTNHRRVLLLRY